MATRAAHLPPGVRTDHDEVTEAMDTVGGCLLAWALAVHLAGLVDGAQARCFRAQQPIAGDVGDFDWQSAASVLGVRLEGG